MTETARAYPAQFHPLHEPLWAHRFYRPEWDLDMPARLCIEHGWSPEEAAAAIEEYRRFVFLAVVAGHPVTPSDQVDPVWHLHLVYTRDYWGVFCPQVLGRSLHHGPTEGGAQEAGRYYDQYAQTLASYARWFGSPPERWWPAASARFAPMRSWRWTYLPDAFVLPRPAALLRRWRAKFLSLTPRRSA